MLIVDDLSRLPNPLPYPVVAIGVFDGVHRGHQAILRRLVERARSRDGTSLVLTFEPHPQKVIAAGLAPPLLQTPAQKEEILRAFSIGVLIRLPFTRELSLYSPERFAREILVDHGIREIHVGANFRFGHRRAGTFATLAEVGKRFGFEVYAVDAVCFRGTRTSSTQVRALLKQGRVEPVRRLLGRPYQICGTVIRGAGRGSTLGFPTANLEVENELIPAPGVYVTRCHVNGRALLSVTNVGFRPTFQAGLGERPVVETHVPGFSENLYGKGVRLDFCLRLRGERKFPGPDALKKQIEKDVRQARKYWARCPQPAQPAGAAEPESN